MNNFTRNDSDNDTGRDACDTAVAPTPTTTAGATTAQPVSENFRNFPTAADRLNDDDDDDEQITPNQRLAVELLATGKSFAAVANACGVTPRTLYNWRRDEAFRHQLSQRQQEIWTEAAQRLRAMVHPSLDIVERQLRDPYDRARFRAATAVLRLADLRKVVAPRED